MTEMDEHVWSVWGDAEEPYGMGLSKEQAQLAAEGLKAGGNDSIYIQNDATGETIE